MSLMLAKSWSAGSQGQGQVSLSSDDREPLFGLTVKLSLRVRVELDVLSGGRGSTSLSEEGVERVAHPLDLLDLCSGDGSKVEQLPVRGRDECDVCDGSDSVLELSVEEVAERDVRPEIGLGELVEVATKRPRVQPEPWVTSPHRKLYNRGGTSIDQYVYRRISGE